MLASVQQRIRRGDTTSTKDTNRHSAIGLKSSINKRSNNEISTTMVHDYIPKDDGDQGRQQAGSIKRQ